MSYLFIANLKQNNRIFSSTKYNFLFDTHNLSSGNHFDSFKSKNTFNVLIILQEKIYLVWKQKKYLALLFLIQKMSLIR